MGIRTDGDWGFFLKETADTLRRHYFSIWLSDSSFGRVLIDAGQAPTYAVYGWLSYYFNLNYALIERLVHMWPSIIIAIVGSYLLTNYVFKNKVAGALGAFVYTTNTYYLTLLTGHLTLAAAYAFVPLVILTYMKAITTGSRIYIVLSALMLAACSAYEPRFAYIVVLILAILAIFHFVISYLRRVRVSFRGVVKMGMLYAAPIGIFVLLNMYWLLGLMMSGGPSGGTVIESSLFGNEFFNLSQAMTLFHPFWSGGEVQPFIVHDIPAYFWLIPPLAIAGFIASKKNYKLLFFGCIGIIGILLSKQSAAPFSSLYSWMFTNFPGFNAYREASKFYMLIALSYSILLPALYLYVKKKFDSRWFSVGLVGLFLLLFLPNLLPFISGKIGSTFAERKMPAAYGELNTFLNQKEYYRTLWLPQKSRWSFVSANHPYVSGSKMLFDGWKDYGESITRFDNATTTDEITKLMGQNFMPDLLSKSSIKYVIVPLRDIANDDDFYRSYNDDPAMFAEKLSRLPYLKEVNQKFDGFKVYETIKQPEQFFSASKDLYAIDSMQALRPQYDIWNLLDSKTDFNFITGSRPSFASDIHDVFGDITSENITASGVAVSPLDTNKKTTYYADTAFSETSYKLRPSRAGNEIVFSTKKLPTPLSDTEMGKTRERIVPLEKGKNYLVSIGDVITLLNKNPNGVSLGSPRKDITVFSIESENIVPVPTIQKSLWQKEPEDCTPYPGKATIDMRSVENSKRQVISLFAKNHSACTGPGPIQVSADTPYLLSFKYRTLGGQFSSYRLTYNNAEKTVITEDLPVADELWRTHEQLITPPKGATSVNIQLIGRPSNQAAKTVYTLFDKLSLVPVKQTAVIPAATGAITKVTDTNAKVSSYKDTTYTPKNIVPGGSFEEGLWQKNVSDCNNYDDEPAIRMSHTDEAADGKKALQLEAKKHIACTGPGQIAVTSGKTYLLEFDYQSPNAKNAGYLLRFDGRKQNQVSERILIKGKGWQTFRKMITIPPEVGHITLSLFSYSDDDSPAKYLVNRYDDVKLLEVPDLGDRFYQVTDSAQPMQMPEKINFTNVSNTLKKVTIGRAKAPFILRMSEQYHPAWKLQYDDAKANDLFNAFPLLAAPKPASSEHLKLNGFQNGWYIDPNAICEANKAVCTKHADGSATIALAVQFNGQRWFNLGLIMSAVTGLGCIALLATGFRKNKNRHVPKVPSAIVLRNKYLTRREKHSPPKPITHRTKTINRK